MTGCARCVAGPDDECTDDCPSRVRATDARDYGLEAHAAAEAHLEACFEGAARDLTGQVFCSCATCIVREVLAAAWPAIDAYCEDAGAPPLPGPGPVVGGVL